MVDYAFSKVIVFDIIELYSHDGVVIREEITPFHGTQTLFEVYELLKGVL